VGARSSVFHSELFNLSKARNCSPAYYQCTTARTTRKTNVIWPDQWTRQHTSPLFFPRHSGKTQQSTCRTENHLVCMLSWFSLREMWVMPCGRCGLTLVNGEVNGVAETSWEARMSRYLHHIQPTMRRDSQLEYLLQ